MKLLWSIMIILILLLQVRLWVGEGSFAQVWGLESVSMRKFVTSAARKVRLKNVPA